MTANCNNCNTLDAPDLRAVVNGEGMRTVRVAVRCHRPGCRGQLYIEPELGSHVVSFACILCGRIAATAATVDLVDRYGITWEQVEAATWNGTTFLWHRIEAPS